MSLVVDLKPRHKNECTVVNIPNNHSQYSHHRNLQSLNKYIISLIYKYTLEVSLPESPFYIYKMSCSLSIL